MKFVNLSSLLRDSSETTNLLSLVASRGLSLDIVTVSTAGNINDYDTSNEGIFKFTGASELRGFGAGRDGKTIYIHNGSAGNITLVNQSGDANAGDRVITGTGGNLTIKPDTGLVLQYDGTSARWRIPAFTKNTPTGDIVGTSDSQTLTNKTLDGFTVTNDITVTSAAIDIDMIDNNASAISFDAPGKSGILEIVTTDGAEKVKMSGGLEVSGSSILKSANVSGTVTLNGLTFPTSDGSPGQALATNGSGVLSFQQVSGGRTGMSPLLASGTVNLSSSTYSVYYANGNAVSGTVTSGSINFTNGTPGEVVYVKVNSGGSGSYSFGSNMKWPSDAAPVPSASGRVDMYSFVCIGTSEFLGTFAFNYS